MWSEQSTGLALAVSSSVFIGSSFIIKKRGLKAAGATGIRAGEARKNAHHLTKMVLRKLSISLLDCRCGWIRVSARANMVGRLAVDGDRRAGKLCSLCLRPCNLGNTPWSSKYYCQVRNTLLNISKPAAAEPPWVCIQQAPSAHPMSHCWLQTGALL